MAIQPQDRTGPGILFGKKRTMNSELAEPSRYGLPLCVLTRFRAFHGRSLWAFLGPAGERGLLRPLKNDLGLPRRRDCEA